MTLGDVLTCADCGARSEPLHDRGGRPFAEGGALISTWRNGPIPRHLTASTVEPIRCAWCNDRILGFPALSARPDRGETWEVGGPLQRYHVPAWHPDQLRLRPDPYAPDAGPTAATCYYLRDGRPTDGCRPTSACWTEACGAAGIARPTGLDDDWGRRSQAGAPLCRPDPNASAEELPPAAPPEPRHRTYLDDAWERRMVPYPHPADCRRCHGSRVDPDQPRSPPPGAEPRRCSDFPWNSPKTIEREFVVIGFKLALGGSTREVRLEVPMPHESEVGTKAKAEAATRQRWRALVLVLKAKLEAVASGISTLESEFLAGIVLPNGMTIGQAVLPRLSEAVSSGRLLPPAGGEG